MSREWVEKPPHADDVRIRHITESDFRRSLRHAAGPLPSVLAAACEPLRSRAVIDLWTWATAIADTFEAERILSEAKHSYEQHIDWTNPDHGRTGLYRLHYLQNLRPLVRAYALTRDPRYADRFTEHFEEWYRTRDQVRGEWPGLHPVWYSLSTWFRSRVLSEAMQILAPVIPVETTLRMAASILGAARWLADEHDHFRYGNWQCAAATSLLEIAVGFPDFIESDTWKQIGLQRLSEHLDLDFYADGGHYERCASYHSVSAREIFRACVAAEHGIGIRLADHPAVRSLHEWPIGISTVDGRMPPFNDSHSTSIAELMLQGHYLFQNDHFKGAAAECATPGLIENILGGLPPRPDGSTAIEHYYHSQSKEPHRQSQVFRQSSLAILRESQHRDAIYVALNYGPHIEHELESHSHRAALDIILEAYGIPLIWEAGGPIDYDDPDYESWYKSTGAHSTVLVSGIETSSERRCTLDLFVTTPVIDILTAAYDDHGRAHKRTIVLVRRVADGPAYCYIHDEVTGVGPHIWLLHGRAPWSTFNEKAFTAGRTPGVHVVTAHEPASVNVGTGPTSWPDSGQGILHTLKLSQAAPIFDVFLFPFLDQIPTVDVERNSVMFGSPAIRDTFAPTSFSARARTHSLAPGGEATTSPSTKHP